MDTVEEAEIAEVIKLNDPKVAFRHCKIKNKRIPELEYIILKSPKTTYWYTYYFVKKCWKLAEEVILQDPFSCYQYSKYIRKFKWPQAELCIQKDEQAQWRYEGFVKYEGNFKCIFTNFYYRNIRKFR